MPRNDAPPVLELLRASLRKALAVVHAHELAIAAIERGFDADLAPKGCDRHVPEVVCSPDLFPRLCVIDGCGAMFRMCARHGGHTAADRELAKHEYAVHRVDDTNRDKR